MNLAPFRAAAELTREERALVEKLVGRPLGDDEVINVRTFRARAAPTGQRKREAARELKRQLDALAERVRNVPPEDVDAALDEALKHVRPTYRNVHEDRS